MTDLHSPMILHHHSPIHVVVPLRPGADLDLVRAKLSGAFAQHDHPVVWHIPRERGDIVQLADRAAEAARDSAGLLVAAGGDGTINAVAAAASAQLAGGALMAELAEGWQRTGTWSRVDEGIAQQLRLHADMAALRWFGALTHLGDTAVLTTLTLAVTAALWWRRHRLLAVGWLVAMAGNGLLTKILKDVFARVRPEHVHGAAQADGFSFPSGHSSASMVAYAMLAYLAVRLLPRAWQVPAVCCAGALIFTTGWSRVVLHVHYVSDVLAGWVLGGTWMVCTVLIMDSMARWRGAPAALARQ